MNTWLFGFLAGMILADLYVNKKAFFEKTNHKATYLLVLAGIVLGSYPSSENITSPFYKLLSIPGFDLGERIAFFITIGATFVVIGVLSIERVKRLFSHPYISGLGKYTFSLYLIHIHVLLTVCTSIFLVAFPVVGLHGAAATAIVTSWVVLIPVVFLFEKYIDAPSIKFAGFCSDVYLGVKELGLKRRLEISRVVLKRMVAPYRLRRSNTREPEPEQE